MQEREMKWDLLLKKAFQLFDDVNQNYSIQPINTDSWFLGGGTALMLQINHRKSFDIDIFFPDNQLLGFIIATLDDIYGGSKNLKFTYLGGRSVSINYPELGNIDCIYSSLLTDKPYLKVKLLGKIICQLTVPEIICSKIVNRGWYFRPRDIFDFAAAYSTTNSEAIETALIEYPKEVLATIKAMESLDIDFIKSQLDDLVISENFRGLKSDAFQFTLDALTRINQSINKS